MWDSRGFSMIYSLAESKSMGGGVCWTPLISPSCNPHNPASHLYFLQMSVLNSSVISVANTWVSNPPMPKPNVCVCVCHRVCVLILCVYQLLSRATVGHLSEAATPREIMRLPFPPSCPPGPQRCEWNPVLISFNTRALGGGAIMKRGDKEKIKKVTQRGNDTSSSAAKRGSVQ